MDFHSLSRRELQFLCKKNKIPANMTNLAMADALTALQNVEGIEELMNPSESGVLQSPARVNAAVPGAGSRTSARRKPIREVEISQPLTQARVTRRTAVKRGEEDKDANVPKTPAVPSNYTRAPVDSACRSLESQMKEEEEEGKLQKSVVPKTPATIASNCRRAPAAASASVQRAYSTRRSVKLLETTMAELSLNKGGNSKAVKIDLPKDVDEPSKDNSEAVPDVVLEVENEPSESDMHTLEETGNISVSVETQDKNEPRVHSADIHEKDKKGAEVPATEFSSEANNLKESAEVLNGVCGMEFSLPQETKELVKAADSAYDINAVETGEHCEHDAEIEDANEVKDDSSKIAHDSSTDEFKQSLDIPDDLMGSDSEWSDDEDKVEPISKVDNQNPSDEVELSTGVPEGMESSDSESEHVSREVKTDMAAEKNQFEEADQAPVLPKEEIDFKFDFEMEGSDSSGSRNDVYVSQALEQTSPQVEVNVVEEAEVIAPTVKTPSSVKPTPFHPQLSGDLGAAPLQILADDVIPLVYQFPRPTQTTPMKEATTTQKMPLLSDDKEIAENNDRKVDDDVKSEVNKIADDLNKMSIRALKRLVKEKTLNQKGGEKKSAMGQQDGKIRAPLQKLSNNQMTVAEQEKN